MHKYRIAVITPYYKEPFDMLLQCYKSVKDQVVDADFDHFFVADGFPNEELMTWDIKHVVLPQSHGDYGNTPRGIGGLLAQAEGYDFITYLDADNWFYEGHLSSLLDLWHSSGADVCCSLRTFHHLDGRQLIGVSESHEDLLEHVDTNCFLIYQNAFACLGIWLTMPKQLSVVGDRIFFSGIKHARYKIAYSKSRTVAYRSQYEVHYLNAGLLPANNLKKTIPFPSWTLTVEGVRETVRKLGYFPF